MNIEKYFAFAKNVSDFSDFYGDKTSKHVGCVIVYKNKVIAVGWNTSKEHPLQKEYNRERDFNVDSCKNSLHAEMYALIRCNYADVEWSRASIFIYRELADGSMAMAKPCKACTKAIKDRGIKTIFYTTENGHNWETW
jgi:deoxycytidylate deaminase